MALVLPTSRVLHGAKSLGAVHVGAHKVWPSPPFTPTDIAGLYAWLDATQDAAASRWSEGQTIDSYTEWSPAHRPFDTQIPSGPKFRYGAGHPYFENIDPDYSGFYSRDPWNPGGAFTFVIVARVTGGVAPMLMTWGPDADGYEMRHNLHIQFVAQYTSYFVVWNGTESVPYGVDFRGVLSAGPGAASIWTNGVKETGPAPPNFTNAAQHLYVGRRPGGYQMIGRIYESLAYAGSVSDRDLGRLDRYLTDKWFGTRH